MKAVRRVAVLLSLCSGKAWTTTNNEHPLTPRSTTTCNTAFVASEQQEYSERKNGVIQEVNI